MDPIGVDVGRAVSERHDRSGWVGTLATTLLTATLGWCAIWSAPVNGDEGYLLLSLREWTIRGGLFDRVYSQYGPFYYALFGGPSRALDIRWTIASGRFVSLVLWVTAAFLIGLTVRALSGRWEFGIAAQVTTFSVLATLVNEPMHPGALLCALLAALLANVAWCRPRAPAVSDLVSGILTAALLLTKVNVGLFAIPRSRSPRNATPIARGGAGSRRPRSSGSDRSSFSPTDATAGACSGRWSTR